MNYVLEVLWYNIFENSLFDELEAGKFSALKAIHKYLFGDIYDFAGEIRTVNISKGSFRFAPIMYLDVALQNLILKTDG